MFRSGPPRRIHPPPKLPPPAPENPAQPEKLNSPASDVWRTRVGWIAGTTLLFVGGGLLFFLLFRGSFYSKNDDEVRTAPILQADYARWSSSLRELTQTFSESNLAPNSILPQPIPTDESTLGWWNRWQNLPPEGLARSVLSRRLPPQIELTQVTPRRLIISEDGVSVDYTITLRAKEDILLAPVIPVGIPKNLSTEHHRLLPKVVYAYDLPPGKVFDLAGAKIIFPVGSTLQGGWTLRQAEHTSGSWKARQADLLPFTRIPALESIFVRESTNPPPALLRSRGELENGEAKRRAAAQSVEDRLTAIREDVKQYRSQMMASAPAILKSKGFGPGSGVPTSAGIGAVGGAATGAGLGSIAGGDGAAIGAGAGALAGMLIGAIVANAEQEKRIEQEKAARRSAIAAIEREITEYQRKLIRELENELTQEGARQESTLARPTSTN